jgi:hypothetical protein
VVNFKKVAQQLVDAGRQALAEAAAAGRALKGIVGRQDSGKTFLLFEEPDQKPTATGRINYRMVMSSLWGRCRRNSARPQPSSFASSGSGPDT